MVSGIRHDPGLAAAELLRSAGAARRRATAAACSLRKAFTRWTCSCPIPTVEEVRSFVHDHSGAPMETEDLVCATLRFASGALVSCMPRPRLTPDFRAYRADRTKGMPY